MLSLNKLEGLEKKILMALQDINKLKSENTLLSNEKSVLKKQLNSLSEKLKVKDDEFSRYESELENTSGQINEINSAAGNLDEKVDILTGKLNEFYGVRENNFFIHEEIIDEKSNSDKIDTTEIEFSDDDFGDIIVLD